jgi:hypothetical protein
MRTKSINAGRGKRLDPPAGGGRPGPSAGHAERSSSSSPRDERRRARIAAADMTSGLVALLVSATVHNRTAAIGLGIAGGGAALFFPSLFGYLRRGTASGKRLQNTTAEQRRGVPFADRQYYGMRWAGRTALVGAALVLIGLIWFLAAGA